MAQSSRYSIAPGGMSLAANMQNRLKPAADIVGNRLQRFSRVTFVGRPWPVLSSGQLAFLSQFHNLPQRLACRLPFVVGHADVGKTRGGRDLDRLALPRVVLRREADGIVRQL